MPWTERFTRTGIILFALIISTVAPDAPVAAQTAPGQTAPGQTAIAQAAPRTLTYASFVPAASPVHKAGTDPFFANVTRKTSGRLTFETFYGGTMGGPNTAATQIRDGLADSAFLNPQYTPSDFPINSLVADILHQDPMVMSGAEQETVLLNCPECMDEYARFDVKPLAFWTLPSYVMECARIVRGLDDLKGLKVRAAGPMVLLAQRLGGTPVNISSAGLYEGMQRGQLDCTVGPLNLLIGYRLVEVTKSVLDARFGTFHGVAFYSMKQSVWDSLTGDQREAIRSELAGMVRRTLGEDLRLNEEARTAGLAKGIVFTAPGPRLTGVIDQFYKDDQARISEKGRRLNRPDIDDIQKRFRAALAKWEKIVASIDHDPDRFEAALEREVFSKLGTAR